MQKSDSKLRRFCTVRPHLNLEDFDLYRVKQSAGSSHNRLLIILLQPLLDEALRQLHNNSRHFGVEKTVVSADDRFWWPGYISDIQH